MRHLLEFAVHYIKSRQRGATAVEYALIVALIALAIVVGVTLVGGGLNIAFQNIAAQIQAAFAGGGGEG